MIGSVASEVLEVSPPGGGGGDGGGVCVGGGAYKMKNNWELCRLLHLWHQHTEPG